MNQNRVLSVLMILGLTIFVSCTPVKRRSDQPAGTPVAKSPTENQGTIDSGGGNTYLGKPLESYIKRPAQDLPSVRNVLQPILDNLHRNAPSIEPVFLSILNKKTWYFVPGKLQDLPKEKIGAAINTDQAALQDFKQVWISTDIFDVMPESDQARLILHEVLMGFRLLRFDSPKNECLAFEANYSECMHKTDQQRGQPSQLTDADYADIRGAVDEIFRRYQGMAFADWSDLLWRHGFSSFERRFSGINQQKKIGIERLSQMIEEAKQLGPAPNHGFEIDKLVNDHPELMANEFKLPQPLTWKSTQTCSFELSITDQHYNFRLTTPQVTISSSSRIAVDALELWDMERLDGIWVSRVDLPYRDDEKTQAPIGTSVYDVNLEFSGRQLVSAHVYEEVCLNSDCSSWGAKTGGLNYECSILSQQAIGKKK